MKKFLMSAVAATLVAAPIMAAAPADAAQRHTTVIKHKANGRTVIKQKTKRPNRTVVRRTTYRAPQVRYRTWTRGQRFDHRYAQNYRVVTNYRSYHRLYSPPRGYHWVRSGNDAVLVAITSGLIGAVIGSAFN